MADCFSKQKRSELMSKVRQKDTKPEVLLRKALWHRGQRYRKQYRAAGIQIDIAIPSASLAIFVDGCFWHACPRHYREPASNTHFWRTKIEKNRLRDRTNNQDLSERGWTVIRVWECEVHDDLGRVVGLILGAISNRAVLGSSTH